MIFYKDLILLHTAALRHVQVQTNLKTEVMVSLLSLEYTTQPVCLYCFNIWTAGWRFYSTEVIFIFLSHIRQPKPECQRAVILSCTDFWITLDCWFEFWYFHFRFYQISQSSICWFFWPLGENITIKVLLANVLTKCCLIIHLEDTKQR